jgi:hypothetical protein
MAFTPFLFFDPKATFYPLLVVQEMTDLQLQQVRDPEGSVYPHHEQQQIAKPFLPEEQVFHLSNLSPITDWFNENHNIVAQKGR